MLDFDQLRASWRVRRKGLDRAQAIYDAKNLARRLFAFLKSRLGAHEARLFFVQFAKQLPSKKTRGASDSMLNSELVDLLEAAVEQGTDKASLPRELATWIDEVYPGKYGNSAKAIEKHLRRLSKERDRTNENIRIMREILEEGERALAKLRQEPADK